MTPMSVLFCGSFLEYSALTLHGLIADSRIQIIGVVTTPPASPKPGLPPLPNPVHQLAKTKNLPVFTPEQLSIEVLSEIETTIGKPHLILTAGYGKLLPETWLKWPSHAALNLHFSLLPKFRGANPAEWALLLNEKETGVTLIEMSPQFDTGTMVAQAAIPITPNDTRETLYQQLYELGGTILPNILVKYLDSAPTETWRVASQTVHYWSPALPQPTSPTPYAKRLSRDDGFVSWTTLQKHLQPSSNNPNMDNDDHAGFSPLMQRVFHQQSFTISAALIERMVRALRGYPGVWTLVQTNKGQKRLKILTAHLATSANTPYLILDAVQLEGQSPATWNQIQSAIAAT